MSMLINILFLLLGFAIGFLCECFLSSLQKYDDDDLYEPFPTIDNEAKS